MVGTEVMNSLSRVFQPLGPIMMDLKGPAITDDEKRFLLNPGVGGVILFSRNIVDSVQLEELCREIHSMRSPALLISIDHEGGRVQRLTCGVTPLPAMSRLGDLAEHSGLSRAIEAARSIGNLVGSELSDLGIDINFSPCLDIEYHRSDVIGDRAIHGNPNWVGAIGYAIWSSMDEFGVSGVAKHFPGHGWAVNDTHVAVAEDLRDQSAIASDLVPFQQLISAGLKGIMPAHCIYPMHDSNPAGYSDYWIRKVLRNDMGFAGAVISDSLSMRAAHEAGSMVQRILASQSAGVDMQLVCNDRCGLEAALIVTETFPYRPGLEARLESLRPVKKQKLSKAARADALRFVEICEQLTRTDQHHRG